MTVPVTVHACPINEMPRWYYVLCHHPRYPWAVGPLTEGAAAEFRSQAPRVRSIVATDTLVDRIGRCTVYPPSAEQVSP